MLVNLVTGLEKDRFQTLVDSVGSRTELDSVLVAVALKTPRRLVAIVVVVARHMNRVRAKCGTLAIGIEKAH